MHEIFRRGALMIKQQSWTRQQYDHAYKVYRRDGNKYDEIWFDNISDEISKAADYSYQAFGYWVSGWSSELRRKRFYEIKWRILTQREELPL